jgi:hypothetical protein
VEVRGWCNSSARPPCMMTLRTRATFTASQFNRGYVMDGNIIRSLTLTFLEETANHFYSREMTIDLSRGELDTFFKQLFKYSFPAELPE